MPHSNHAGGVNAQAYVTLLTIFEAANHVPIAIIAGGDYVRFHGYPEWDDAERFLAQQSLFLRSCDKYPCYMP